MEHREWSTAVVAGRSADDYEAECLVEAAYGGVLLVDVDGQVAVALLLGVCDEPAPAALPAAGRLEEERRDVMAGEPRLPHREHR